MAAAPGARCSIDPPEFGSGAFAVMGIAFVCLFGTAAVAQLPPDAPREDSFEAPEGYKPLGPALWFDPERRALIMRAQIVKREGFLEHLVCLRNTKEHEAILATDAVPRLIHAGLLLTGVEPGHPVQYRPEFKPPEGPPIRIEIEWKDKGETKRADARSWVEERETGKLMQVNWVFAGSMKIDRPEFDELVYAADGGDLITVANFPEAILDVPFPSTNSDEFLDFVAHTEAIPPLGTFVTLVLQPAEEPAKD